MTRWVSSIWSMPELRSRVLFTLGMIAVFRLGAHILLPGVNPQVVSDFVEANKGSLFGLYDMISGGALLQCSVFSLGVTPYITASIIFQILTVVVPQLERISKEGQTGRNRITQYTRYATIGIAAAQGFAIAMLIESQTTGQGDPVVFHPGMEFRLVATITMAAGSCLVMWLGEQISERGIGNGSSLIITAGIVSRLPSSIYGAVVKVQNGELSLLAVALLVSAMLLVVGLIIWIERAQRRIPIQYAKRVVGRRVYGGQTTHLPLKINVTGVIPPIFASSLLMFPSALPRFAPELAASRWGGALLTTLQPGAWLYNYCYVLLIVFFAYFYTALMFNPVDVADNLKKHAGYIPSVRPGKQTAAYIDHILSRLTGAGALYLAAVCILPTLMFQNFGSAFAFGGTSLLIVVGVSLDTVAQIEAQLLTRHYDGIQGPKPGGVGGGGRRRLLTAAGGQEAV